MPLPPTGFSPRQRALALLRSTHKTFMMKRLPDRLAIYFHALEPADRPQFRACIAFFASEGYRFVPVSQFVDPDLTGRALFVSFDDNYKNWHDSLEFFADVKVRATFYVNSLPFMDTCAEPERRSYFQRIAYPGPPLSMTTNQLRELAQAGHAIGCHTHSHHNLARLDRSRWQAEILDSRNRLEDLLARPIVDFAYPYGMRRFFSERLRAYCRSLGFETIASAIPGLQHAAPIDPFNIHRTRWNFTSTLEENVEDLRIDGRLFEALTGRSAVG